MGSAGRKFRKRRRALLKVKHKRVYSFSRAQLIASFFLSFCWTIAIGPQIEKYGLPHLINAVQEINRISEEPTYIHGGVTGSQVALGAVEQLTDPMDQIAKRIRTMKVKSNHLSLLAVVPAGRA